MTNREIDEIVLRHVFGRVGCEVHKQQPVDLADELECAKWHIIPVYSESIDLAWQVVEKMRERGYFVDIDNEITVHDGRWFVCFFNESGDASAFGRDDSAPKAICLAALKALGVNVAE